MIVKVADLSDEVRQLSFSVQPGLLNAVLADTPNVNEQAFEAPLEISAEMYRHGQDVFLVGKLDGDFSATCCRCAEEFHGHVDRSFKFLLVPAAQAAAEGLEDDRGLDHYEGDEIDVLPIVSEQALLALDAAPVCSSECKGLCVGCGANKNSEVCSCS